MRRILLVAGLAAGVLAPLLLAQEFHPDIPKAWDDAAVKGLEVPLAERDRSPRYMSTAEYYKLKVRPSYRSYPAYAKGREPAGYLEALKQKESEIIFDPSKLHTKEDWIAAGKLVFESDTQFFPAQEQPAGEDAGWPVTKDGVLPDFVPGFRYYIREKGVLEGGINSCAGCHTRLMPDGSYLEGAQGSVDRPTTAAFRLRVQQASEDSLRRRRDRYWINFGVPWVMSREAFDAYYTRDRFIQEQAARHPGVLARQGTSYSHPPHIPSLIGVMDRKYWDATGLVHNRSLADLMRYAILNEGLDTLANFGDFQPSAGATAFSGDAGTRCSDEQLYALALYVASLKPPPNPNPFNDDARRGEQVFRQQGCPMCHTPPLYTNNKLTPANGFKVPEDLRRTEDILDICIGTDPSLALQTRRGTGFYKVPSLRGVWFRNAFGHAGQAEALEEWFDPNRLRPDYEPKGFHVGPGPIEGHPFGLRLSPVDKRALIAFLKTL
jgi:hypothetical protein